MTEENKIDNATAVEEPVLKQFNTENHMHKKMAPIVIIVAIVFGVLTGWAFAKSGIVPTSSTSTSGNKSASDVLKNTGGGQVVGSKDTKTFKDCTKGKLTKNDGKITNEGSHILVRDGGESQNVYLTSSVVDLDQFVNKNIEVCGQTNQAQKAGWLLDVGIVKVQ